MNQRLCKSMCAPVLLIASACFAHATPASAEGLSLFEFQVGGLAIYQGGGNTYSAQLGWTPTYRMGGLWVRGDFAGSVLKGLTDNRFVSLSYQALVGLAVWSSLGLEAGGGAETWPSNGGTSIALSSNAVWSFNEKIFGIVSHLFVGYERYFISNSAGNEFKLGVGIAF